jgi:hypothetical protein
MEDQIHRLVGKAWGICLLILFLRDFILTIFLGELISFFLPQGNTRMQTNQLES